MNYHNNAPHVMFVRQACKDDVPQICDIGKSATTKFALIPELASLALDEASLEEVQQWLNVGRVYVIEELDQALGFVAAYPMDDVLHIAEMSVHVDHQCKGVGAALLKSVCNWALVRSEENREGKARVSLMTYADVPWNGPFYRRHGFDEVQPEIIGPQHVRLYEQDARNLSRPGYRRSCMLWESEVLL